MGSTRVSVGGTAVSVGTTGVSVGTGVDVGCAGPEEVAVGWIPAGGAMSGSDETCVGVSVREGVSVGVAPSGVVSVIAV